jgi:hypothetical protein
VAITVNDKMSTAAFTSVKKQSAGAVGVSGVGDNAFYVASTRTLQFIKGRSAVVMQASLRAAGGGQGSAGRVRSDLVAFARSVAATL